VLTYGVGMQILQVPMSPTYNAMGIIGWLIFTILLGSLASALPARLASKLTVRDTLAYE
jgi:ABC-type lipoprotein release transport system permease subunit